jgi:hypothetical protein
MIIWPANVPVIVELCPAAINATANKIGAHLVPNNGAKTYAHPEFQLLHTFQLYKMWLQPKLISLHLQKPNSTQSSNQ